MLRIKYNGKHNILRLAVNHVNNLLQQDFFYDHIKNHSAFDMCNISPQLMAGLMRTADMELEIDLYYSLFPFNKAVAYDDPVHSGMICLNKWNLNRPVDSICNTIMHQCVHAVNAYFPNFSFGHGDNNSEGKENTAPYWIASLAQKLVADDNSIFEAMTHDDINNIPFIEKFKVKPISRSSYNFLYIGA